MLDAGLDAGPRARRQLSSSHIKASGTATTGLLHRTKVPCSKDDHQRSHDERIPQCVPVAAEPEHPGRDEKPDTRDDIYPFLPWLRSRQGGNRQDSDHDCNDACVSGGDARAPIISAHTAPALHLPVCCAAPSLRNIEWFHDHVRIEQHLFDGSPMPKHGRIRPDLTRPGHGLNFRERDAERMSA